MGVVIPAGEDLQLSPEHLPRTACEGCPFGGPRVGSKGQIDSLLVLVGESPGATEVKTGIPFAGDSGTVLHHFIPEGPYVLNAMECSPNKRVKNPRLVDYAARTCNNRLVDLIQKHPRRLIVAMGNAAVRSLTGDYTLKITQIRGRLIQSPYAELGILPVVHPAALMRGTGNFRQFRDDLLYARFLMEGGQPAEYIKPDWVTVEDPVTAINDLLQTGSTFTADIETSGLSHILHRILNAGITADGQRVYLFRPDHLPLLKQYLESRHITWCWHNGKFDVKFFRQLGIQARVDEDTMLMSYAMDEQRGVHDLETVSNDVLDAPDYKFMLQPYLPSKKASYEHVPEEVLDEYASIDVGNTARILEVYRPRVLEDTYTHKLYSKTLIPASEMLAQVESNGLYVDQEWLDDLDDYLTSQLDACERRIHQTCGRTVNPASPQQMQDVLFRQFRLPNRKKGSTDKDVLKKFSEHPRTRLPIVLQLIEHRGLAKQYGTYVKGIRKHLHPDGRVYPTFLLHGTLTGRLACRNPNLQNIPRDWMIRGMFTPAPGRVLLEVDLSQAELRSLAALSGDPVMVALYLEGRSIHKELAIYLFGPNYTYEQYTKCKNVNFGIIYGITEYGLMEQINGTVEQAREMINGWKKRFPVAWAFIDKCRSTVLSDQTIRTTFGRRKRVYLVTRENFRFLQNEAANFPHQSIASDITLHAGIRTEPRLRMMDVKIVNLIHDALLMECPDEMNIVHEAARMVAYEMQQVPKDWGIKRVPFVAEATIGGRWGKENMGKDFQPLKEAA